MVRLSDFIFPTANPPRMVDAPVQNNIARIRVPGKRGNIQQDMGRDNMELQLRGGFYSTAADTDKHNTDLDELMALAVRVGPFTFAYDESSIFGANGDVYSEYANTTAMDAIWTTSGPTRNVNAAVEKVGSYCLKFTNPGTGNRRFDAQLASAINMNNPKYSSFCFWVRTTNYGANDDLIITLATDNFTKYYQQKVDISAWVTASATWTEIVLPAGEGAPTNTALGTNGWTTTSTPDWTNINYMRIEWESASATGTWYFDGVTMTTGVLVGGLPGHTYPMGRPNQRNYRLAISEYLQ